MITHMHVAFGVEDYEQWKEGYDASIEQRKASGEASYRRYRDVDDVDDPDIVTVMSVQQSAEQVQAFLDSPDLGYSANAESLERSSSRCFSCLDWSPALATWAECSSTRRWIRACTRSRAQLHVSGPWCQRVGPREQAVSLGNIENLLPEAIRTPLRCYFLSSDAPLSPRDTNTVASTPLHASFILGR